MIPAMAVPESLCDAGGSIKGRSLPIVILTHERKVVFTPVGSGVCVKFVGVEVLEEGALADEVALLL